MIVWAIFDDSSGEGYTLLETWFTKEEAENAVKNDTSYRGMKLVIEPEEVQGSLPITITVGDGLAKEGWSTIHE